MKINYDCIRDVLLYLEEHLVRDEDTGRFKTVTFQQLICDIDNYSDDDLIYTLRKLAEINYIDMQISIGVDGSIHVSPIREIMYSGHEYIDTLRDNDIWKKTKQKMSKVGTVSLQLMLEVGKSIILETLGIK